MTSSTDDEPRGAARRRAAPRTARCASASVALGAHDALRDGRLRDQERARDLVGGQAAEQAQRQRDARLGRQHRVAGGEHQAQQVVADVVVERGLEVGRHASCCSASSSRPELLVLALEQLAAGAARRSRGAWRSPSATRPGCPGTPDSGHCSSAATSASCASSSARPTSRTMRASPAIRLRRLDAPDRVDRAVRVGRPSRRRCHTRTRFQRPRRNTTALTTASVE